MDITTEHAPLSDTDGGDGAERPVREQLKKTSIENDTEVKPAEPANEAVATPPNTNGERGRLPRKRSFEDTDVDQATSAQSAEQVKPHARKRSRDSTAEEEALNNGRKISGERRRDDDTLPEVPVAINGAIKPLPAERARTPSRTRRAEDAVEGLASPKTKRSRVRMDEEEKVNAVGLAPPSELPEASAEEGTLAENAHKMAESEPAAVATIESKTEGSAATAPEPGHESTSGFANTSAVSPFGALAKSKSPSVEPQTSASAFASSGFGSLAASATSGFGAIGKTSGGFGTGGGFATAVKSTSSAVPTTEEEKPQGATTGAFGGTLGQTSAFAAVPAASSPFGSGTSGFGKLGGGTLSGFGGGLGSSSPFGGAAGKGGLSSFASGKPSASIAGSSKSPKPFGAPADDDEDGDGDDDEGDNAGYKSPPLSQDEDRHDERFHEQHIETGEEDERTEYSCRAKLYNYAKLDDGKKEWRERGLGVLRLNVKDDDDAGGKPKARILMRADGSHRVVLNTPVKKEIKFGSASGGPPEGGLMLFMGAIDGNRLEMLQLKMRQQFAVELYEKIKMLQDLM